MKHTCQKLFSGLTATILLLTLCVVPSYALDSTEEVTGVATVVSETVRIRTSADLAGDVLGQAPQGAVMALINQSGDWHHVAFNGMDGYVYGDFVSCRDTARNLSGAAGKIVNADTALRTGPSENAVSIVSISQNTTLYVTGFQSGWYQVSYAGYLGYVAVGSLMLTDISAVSDTVFGIVNDSEVRLRSEANTDAEIITILDKNAVVSIQETLDSWYRITSGSTTGYVSASFVSVLPSGVSASSTAVTALGRVVDSEVRLRSDAGTDADILASLGSGALVSILDYEDGWYRVNSEGTEGCVSSDFLSAQTAVFGLSTYGKLTEDANLRTDPSFDSSTLVTVSAGNYVDVSGFVGGWFQVSYDGQSGYIAGDCLYMTSVKEVAASASTSSTSSVASSSSASSSSASLPSGASAGSGSYSDVVSLAQSYLGVSYVYGGASPSGFDCSGFTMYVFSRFGYSLPHGATGQLNYGSAVSQGELQPGDLVFFQDYDYSYSAASHVGIYIGGGQFIHASSGPGYCVKISSLSESYYASHYLAGRRL